jgi:PleD family two-component response regulator
LTSWRSDRRITSRPWSDRRTTSRPWRVLIASGDAALGDLYRQDLESRGWSVTQIQDGEDAFRNALSFQPDVLLLNTLRSGTRTRLLKRLRGDARTRSIVVILLANSPNEADVGRLEELGVTARLVKNRFMRQKLPDIILNHVERRVDARAV